MSAPRPVLSVVVFASGRAILARTLAALAAQTLDRSRYEVVVVAPARRRSVDLAVLAARDLPEPPEIHRVAGSARRGAAHNQGVAEAEGDVIVFLAEDFVPSPGLLAEHLALHEAAGDAWVTGVGPGRFPASLRPTAFMRWLETSGQLFGTRFPEAGPLEPPFWYAANASIRREAFLGLRGFDSRFLHEAGDDADFWRRLLERPARVVYLPRATAEHRHRLGLWERLKSVRWAGEAFAAGPSGGSAVPPPGAAVWRLGLEALAAGLAWSAFGGARRRRRWFRRVTRWAFERGRSGARPWAGDVHPAHAFHEP